jgi:hypothetical protein
MANIKLSSIPAKIFQRCNAHRTLLTIVAYVLAHVDNSSVCLNN